MNRGGTGRSSLYHICKNQQQIPDFAPAQLPLFADFFCKICRKLLTAGEKRHIIGIVIFEKCDERVKYLSAVFRELPCGARQWRSAAKLTREQSAEPGSALIRLERISHRYRGSALLDALSGRLFM